MSSETARAAQIVRAVTTAEEAFACLECGRRFEDFASLHSHKAAEGSGGGRRRRTLAMVARGTALETKYKGGSPRVAKSATYYSDEDYSSFISKAIRQVGPKEGVVLCDALCHCWSPWRGIISNSLFSIENSKSIIIYLSNQIQIT